jgi:hypothetical protein
MKEGKIYSLNEAPYSCICAVVVADRVLVGDFEESPGVLGRHGSRKAPVLLHPLQHPGQLRKRGALILVACGSITKEANRVLDLVAYVVGTGL